MKPHLHTNGNNYKYTYQWFAETVASFLSCVNWVFWAVHAHLSIPAAWCEQIHVLNIFLKVWYNNMFTAVTLAHIAMYVKYRNIIYLPQSLEHCSSPFLQLLLKTQHKINKTGTIVFIIHHQFHANTKCIWSIWNSLKNPQWLTHHCRPSITTGPGGVIPPWWWHTHSVFGVQICPWFRWVPSGQPQPSTGASSFPQRGSGEDRERHVWLQARTL